MAKHTDRKKEDVLKAVRASLEREPMVNLHRYPIQMDYEDGVLILEGEAERLAAKKVAMELAAAVPGVTGIVDRLCVVPSHRMGDGAVLDGVRDAFLAEPALENCTLRLRSKGKVETVREALSDPHGDMEVSVQDGVVLLDNTVVNRAQKRLAGALAWWVPGARNVVNGLEVLAPEEDNDDEMTDAVRMILEKNRFIDAGQIRVIARNYVVTLEGLVRTESQKAMAENDAWSVFDVDKVVNHLKVQR
jgi:osmotically-inducible protein OsmY